MTGQDHRLGDVLRTAREAMGVDLRRVERETRIRERYLSALEEGNYNELPGAVYTRGFLRNYGAYLGLDAEDLVDLYRLETAAPAERSRPLIAPRPLAVRRRRTFVLPPGALSAVALTLLVAAFIGYLGWELVTFAATPELRVTHPPGSVAEYGALTYTIRGITEPNALVKVEGLPQNPTVTADTNGAFAMTVELVPGSNQFTIQAFDPVTRRDADAEQRTITVVTAAASMAPTPALAMETPTEGAEIASPVVVAGRGPVGASVEVRANLVEAAPGLTVLDDNADPVPVAPQALAPVSAQLTIGGDGTFSASLDLAPGRWLLSVTSAAAGLAATERAVAVPAPPVLAGILRVAGGDSYLELDADGLPVAGAGGIRRDGDQVALAATTELRIRAGNAGAVSVTLNGFDLGPMGAGGQVVEWRITRTGG